jgi:hypothetical protein
VVEVLPKSEPPDGAGVAAALPNIFPTGFAAFPKRALPPVCPEAGASPGLGVCDPPPNKDGD